VKCTSYEAPRYAVLLTLPPLPPYKVQIFSSTPCSQNNLCSSLILRDQISQPYKTTVKIKLLCILISKFLEKETGRQKTLKRMLASIPHI